MLILLFFRDINNKTSEWCSVCVNYKLGSHFLLLRWLHAGSLLQRGQCTCLNLKFDINLDKGTFVPKRRLVCPTKPCLLFVVGARVCCLDTSLRYPILVTSWLKTIVSGDVTWFLWTVPRYHSIRIRLTYWYLHTAYLLFFPECSAS